jgi:hypothetical protein
MPGPKSGHLWVPARVGPTVSQLGLAPVVIGVARPLPLTLDEL